MSNDGRGSSFVWQDAAVVVLIVVAIVVWQMGDEVSGVDAQQSIVGESPAESPAVGRSISSTETRVETKRQDDIGDKALARSSTLSAKLIFPPGRYLVEADIANCRLGDRGPADRGSAARGCDHREQVSQERTHQSFGLR